LIVVETLQRGLFAALIVFDAFVDDISALIEILACAAFFGPHPAIPGGVRAWVIGGSGGLVACAESETMVQQPVSAAAARD
jgi:hypothetical protein